MITRPSRGTWGGDLPLDEIKATIFFQLVSARYERGSSIVTSNKSSSEWGSIFGDTIIATAILDRLRHHSTTINICGNSYRLKERRRGGLIGGQEQETGESGTVSMVPAFAPPYPRRKAALGSAPDRDHGDASLTLLRVRNIAVHPGQRTMPATELG